MPTVLKGVAPSILSADFARLGEHVSEVVDAGAKVIHVDVMDGHFVPPITIGPLVLGALRGIVDGRDVLLDVHLMIENPERQIDSFVDAGADAITIHFEATAQINYTLQAIRAAGCKAGVAINPGTPVGAIEELADEIDLCLCMSVNPGWGGQKFLPHSLDKLSRLRKLLPTSVVLSVDGGVNLQTIGQCAEAGAELFVAGAAVFAQPSPADAFKALTAAAQSA